ncbi:hypothetical protein VTN96DRAFT_6374 [Rasamsonia emersonii]
MTGRTTITVDNGPPRLSTERARQTAAEAAGWPAQAIPGRSSRNVAALIDSIPSFEFLQAPAALTACGVASAQPTAS